jgi:hypothetical protein
MADLKYLKFAVDGITQSLQRISLALSEEMHAANKAKQKNYKEKA